MENNVYFANLKGIVEVSYDGGAYPKRDWNTAIDMYNAAHHITAGMEPGEIDAQRSAFLQHVKTRKYRADGTEIEG